METKGSEKKSSSNSSSLQYKAPLDYSIEDIRPNGGIEKFRSTAYSNVCVLHFLLKFCFMFLGLTFCFSLNGSYGCSALGSHPDIPSNIMALSILE